MIEEPRFGERSGNEHHPEQKSDRIGFNRAKRTVNIDSPPRLDRGQNDHRTRARQSSRGATDGQNREAAERNQNVCRYEHEKGRRVLHDLRRLRKAQR